MLTTILRSVVLATTGRDAECERKGFALASSSPFTSCGAGKGISPASQPSSMPGLKHRSPMRWPGSRCAGRQDDVFARIPREAEARPTSELKPFVFHRASTWKDRSIEPRYIQFVQLPNKCIQRCRLILKSSGQDQQSEAIGNNQGYVLSIIPDCTPVQMRSKMRRYSPTTGSALSLPSPLFFHPPLYQI
jgi:hypothetical protein